MKINPKKKPELEIASELIPDLDDKHHTSAHRVRFDPETIADTKVNKGQESKSRENRQNI